MVQWLRLCPSNAEGVGSIPGQGTKIPHAAQPKSKNKQTENSPSLLPPGASRICSPKPQSYTLPTADLGLSPGHLIDYLHLPLRPVSNSPTPGSLPDIPGLGSILAGMPSLQSLPSIPDTQAQRSPIVKERKMRGGLWAYGGHSPDPLDLRSMGRGLGALWALTF